MTVEQLLIIFFLALSCFVVINFILSLILWKYLKHPIYKRTVNYWIATIIFFAFQFFFPNTPAQISFAYAAGILPMVYVNILVAELFGKQPRVKKYLVIHLLAFSFTVVLWWTNQNFTTMTLPLSVSMSLPLVAVLNTIFITERHRSTILQKMLAGLLLFWIPHCFSFAFYRLEPNAQFYGWLLSYTLYDMMAILLPAIAIEESFKNDKQRLEEKVRLRTAELKEALNDKETLLKILVHDISTPLTVMRWYLSKIKKNPITESLNELNNVLKSQEIVENIVNKVRILQAQPMAKEQDYPVISFQDCINELRFVFQKTLEAKNIHLEVVDECQGKDNIKADQFSLTHNVLSNFLSNAIKFSYPHSTIKIKTVSDESHLIVTIQDFGVGMNEEFTKSLIDENRINSTLGTMGENGNGLGISIATTILKNFQGKLEIDSQEFKPDSQVHGTVIKLTFPLA